MRIWTTQKQISFEKLVLISVRSQNRPETGMQTSEIDTIQITS